MDQDELLAVELAGDLFTMITSKIIGDGPTRSADIAELAIHIHAVQNMVLANCAARAYPGQFRSLGGVVETNVESAPYPVSSRCQEAHPTSPYSCLLKAGHGGPHARNGITWLEQRGKPRYPTTWSPRDPEPPTGTVIAFDLGTPMMFVRGEWLVGERRRPISELPSDGDFRVLRWGWVK